MRMVPALLLLALLAVQAWAPLAHGQDPLDAPWEASCTVHIVAVASAGGGVLGNLTVTVRYPGEGRVFISTSPASMVDTQGSARIAAFAASLLAGVDMLRYDFYYEVRSPSIIIGGPSAGAAMALATLSLLTGVECPGDVVITGMIQPDTSIGPVGGLKEKLEAAAEGGARLFIVPAGQEVYTYYVTRYERIGPFVRVVKQPVQVNLTEYGQQLGVRVETAASLAEAYTLATGIDLLPSQPQLPGLPDWIVPVLEGYVKDQNRTIARLLVQVDTGTPYIAMLAGNASAMINTSLALLESGDIYPAAVNAVIAEAYARAAATLTYALANDLDVTPAVEEANRTLMAAWNASVEAARTAEGTIQLDAVIKAYAKLGLASYYYQLALANLAGGPGGYYLPRTLFGVDPTGAELLGFATAAARWAWFWANTTSSLPPGDPYSMERVLETARLLLSEAKTTVAYVQTLLDEAGADTEKAALAVYLADQAMSTRDPVAQIGFSIESIAESTRAIHESFTLDPAATADQLTALAMVLAEESVDIGVQGVLAAHLAVKSADTMEQLLSASRAILYSWTILEIAQAPPQQQPPPQPACNTTTVTATTTQTIEKTTTITETITGEAQEGQVEPQTGTALLLAGIAIVSLLAGAAIGLSTRR